MPAVRQIRAWLGEYDCLASRSLELLVRPPAAWGLARRSASQSSYLSALADISYDPASTPGVSGARLTVTRDVEGVYRGRGGDQITRASEEPGRPRQISVILILYITQRNCHRTLLLRSSRLVEQLCVVVVVLVVVVVGRRHLPLLSF